MEDDEKEKPELLEYRWIRITDSDGQHEWEIGCRDLNDDSDPPWWDTCGSDCPVQDGRGVHPMRVELGSIVDRPKDLPK